MSFKTTFTSDNILKGEPKDFNFTTGLGGMLLQKLKEHTRSVLFVDAITGEELTAADILRDAIALAEALRGLGVQQGDVIAICSENRLEYPVVIAAILFIGATCATLNPLYTNHELKHTMSISCPSFVFCSPLSQPKLLEVQRELSCIKKIIVFGEITTDETYMAYNELISKKGSAVIDNFEVTPIDIHSSVVVVLCSSGTTGLPKCVELTHFSLSCYVHTMMDPRNDVSWQDTQIFMLPFFHAYGIGVTLFSISLNVKTIVMKRFQDKLFLESIQKYKCTSLNTVPPILIFLAKNPLVDQYDLSSLKKIRCGAAPLSEQLIMEVMERIRPNYLVQAYGMTETSTACIFSSVVQVKIGSSGQICPGMDCKVIDVDSGKALPPLARGELCFKGPFVMKGYKNNKKATDEIIDKDGWLHSGDIAYYDEDGCIFIVDRLKDLIKYKGYQVAPAEIEDLLLKHPSVQDAAVIGVPDDEAGELPLAFIVPRPGQTTTVLDIQKFVADRVSPQKRLTGGVRFMEAIPKNPSGKILRRELRDILHNEIK